MQSCKLVHLLFAPILMVAPTLCMPQDVWWEEKGCRKKLLTTGMPSPSTGTCYSKAYGDAELSRGFPSPAPKVVLCSLPAAAGHVEPGGQGGTRPITETNTDISCSEHEAGLCTREALQLCFLQGRRYGSWLLWEISEQTFTMQREYSCTGAAPRAQ